MALTMTLDIPSINGNVELGLAVGIDPSLVDADKLPVLADSRLSDAAAYAAVYMSKRHAESPLNALYTSAAYAVVSTNFICTVGPVPDGDWVMVNPGNRAQYTQADYNAAASMINNENSVNMLILALATKANWWLSNHHTGTSPNIATGYVKKVLDTRYPNHDQGHLVRLAHTIGHWVSTLGILNLAGVKGVRATLPFPEARSGRVTLSDDATLRFSGLPAGTHKLAIAYAAGKRLLMSPIGQVCPASDDFNRIPVAYRMVLANPASYHVGAGYLTGETSTLRSYQDSVWDGVLGRIGSYVQALIPKSTLAKSPHVSADRIVNYEDYSKEWDDALRQYKRTTVISVQYKRTT